LILLIAAALLVRSFWNVTSIDLGFDPNDLVTMSVSLPESYEGAQYAAVMHDVLDELNKMENVDVVAISTGLPMFSIQGLRTSSAGPNGEVRQLSGANGVSASYFDALRIRILEGRTFSPSEARNGTPLAILSEGAARTLFPEGDPVGKFVRTQVGATETVLTVVGIVADVRPILFFEKLPTVYVTSGLLDSAEFIGVGGPRVFLVARTTLKQEDVKRVVANIRPDAVTRFERMDNRLSINQASHRFRMFVLGAFAAIAAALAAIGVYSVLAYAVRQRTRELGIRMSLGAQQSGLFWHVVRWALPPAAVGLLIGLGVSYAFAEVAAAYVYEIQPRDTLTYFVATLFLLTVLLVGAALPAIRAARLDPIRALRCE
jgi:putative ABC transport system permease protein